MQISPVHGWVTPRFCITFSFSPSHFGQFFWLTGGWGLAKGNELFGLQLGERQDANGDHVARHEGWKTMQDERRAVGVWCQQGRWGLLTDAVYVSFSPRSSYAQGQIPLPKAKMGLTGRSSLAPIFSAAQVLRSRITPTKQERDVHLAGGGTNQ